MKFLKGFRTYISLALIALLGATVDIQASCLSDVTELGESICKVAQSHWVGKAIVFMTAVAAWFRKLANK